MSLHTVFGPSDPEYMPGLYEDGDLSLRLSNCYYVIGSPGSVVGARIYITPALYVSMGNGTVTLSLKIIDYPMDTNALAAAGTLRTENIAFTSPGWKSATWTSPVPLPLGKMAMVVVNFNTNRYQHMPLANTIAGAKAAFDQYPLYLAESGSRSAISLNGGANWVTGAGAWYGLDVILDDLLSTPEPVNVGPSVNAGVDKAVTGGTTVVVNATASDSDGTIASYVWSRVSGPVVQLNGSGSARTFVAPDVTSTLVLRCTVTDDDGATAQDTVSINITAQPVVEEPEPEPEPLVGDMELAVNRRNTAAFIAADPIDLVLTPHELMPTASGGSRRTPSSPRQAQTVRLIPGNDRMPEIRSSAGRVSQPTYTLLATWDADIAQWDTFMYKGLEYEIATPIRPLHTDRAYELKGDVVVR